MTNIFRIAICGASQVGKTCLYRYLLQKEQDNEKYYPTMGVNCETMVTNGTSMIYYDFSGDAAYHKMTLSHVKKADLLLLVYDIYEKNTLTVVDRLYKEYMFHGWRGEIILVGNKKEASYMGSTVQLLDYILEAEQLASDIGVSHIVVNCKTEENMNQLKDTIKNILNPLTRHKATVYTNPRHRKHKCSPTCCIIS